MNIAKFIISTYIFMSISGCELQSDTVSAGVSLGGTGLPETGGTMPPLKSEEPDNVPLNQFVLWSKGEIEYQCSGLKISTQLMHPTTRDKVDIGYGYPIVLEDSNYNNRVGIVINIQNESSTTLYSFSENCQPALKLKNMNDEEQELSSDSECTHGDSVLKLNPGEQVEYKYIFSLPNGDLERDLSYTHKYSFDNPKEKLERESCEVNYPLFLER